MKCHGLLDCEIQRLRIDSYSLNCFFQFGACHNTRMPAGYGFFVPITLEQFFSADSLRIIQVQNLPPSAFLAFDDIRPALEFRNDPLQIEFANSLKQSFAMLLDVIHVQKRFMFRDVTQQTPQLRLPVEHLLAAQIRARIKQQIKGSERRLATMEQ